MTNLKKESSMPTEKNKDIALHLREQSKRTDLPDDVIRTFSEAYAEIVRLEDLIKAKPTLRQIKSMNAMDRLAELDEELGLNP